MISRILIINDAVEHQRTQAALLGGAVDNLQADGMGFFGRVDKRIGGALEINAFKLIRAGLPPMLSEVRPGAVGK